LILVSLDTDSGGYKVGFIIVPLLLLGLAICFGLCMLSRYIVIKTTKSRFGGRMAFFVTFCTIFWHDIYTWSRFNYLCGSSGANVYGLVPVKGFLYDRDHKLDNDTVKYYLETYRYEYIEVEGFAEGRKEYQMAKNRGYEPKPVLYRFSLDADGNVIKKIISKAESDFLLSGFKTIYHSPYIYETRQAVMNIRTNELLGKFNKFTTRGGWLANRFFDSLGLSVGTANTCPEKGGAVEISVLSIPPITSLESQK
jgi:hypothetical protein